VVATLSTPVHQLVTQTTAEIAVTTDESGGVLSWIADPSATEPTPENIAAGNNAAGAPATAADSASVIGAGIQPWQELTALTPNTDYYYWLTQDTPEIGVGDVVLFTDFFDRGDQILDGSGWLYDAASNELLIRNNQIQQYSQQADGHAVYENTTTNPDQYAEMTFVRPNASSFTKGHGLATRYVHTSYPDDIKFYRFVALKEKVQILYYTAWGTFTILAEKTLAELAYTWTPTSRIRGQSVGSTHKMFLDGNEVMTVEDATHSPAVSYIGLYCNDDRPLADSSISDNFTCGTTDGT
jgi:hypothetical protein